MNNSTKAIHKYEIIYNNKDIIKYLIFINSPSFMRGLIDVARNIDNQDLIFKSRLIISNYNEEIKNKINSVLDHIYDVNNKILKSANAFIKIDENLEIKKYKGSDRFHGMCERNPLYACLITKSEGNKDTHIKLKALFLVCNIYNLIRFNDEDYFNNPDNIENIIPINNDAIILSRFIRKTSFTKNDGRLNELSSCVTVDDYKKYFESDKSKYSKSKSSISNYLNISLYNKIKSSRKGGGGYYGFREIERIGGFISYEGNIHTILDDDNLILNFPNPLDQEEIESDLDPGENDGHDLLIINNGDNPNHARIFSKNQVNHIAASNQYLPCDFNILSPYEVGNLLTKAKTHIEDSRDNLDKKSMILLIISFILGRDIDDIVQTFNVSIGENETIKAKLNLIIKKDSSYFCIKTILVSDLQFESKNCDVEKLSDLIRIPDLVGISNYIRKLNDESNLFFDSDIKVYKNNINKFLKSNLDLNRITLTKIKNQLFHTIVNIQSKDTSIASIVTERLHGISKTQLHYTALPNWKIEEDVISAQKLIIGKAKDEGFILDTYNHDWICKQSNTVVGSKLMPKLESLKSAIFDIQNILRELKRDENSIVKFHNLYTYYTHLLISYSSGYRAVKNPFIGFENIDEDTNSLIIRDKDGQDGYNTRLIYIPDQTIKQIKKYDEHRRYILDKLCIFPDEIWNQDEVPFLFFIDEKFNIETLRPKNILNISEDYLHLPANTNRRFIRSYLVANNIHPEFIDYFMGHWALGQEPWGRYSTLKFSEFKLAILQSIQDLLDSLGLHVFQGYKR